MANQTYAVPGLVLQPSDRFSQQVQDLQRDLRLLGYVAGPIDGVYGGGTSRGVSALQFDLMHYDGTSGATDGKAPVAIKSYNNGSVTAQTGIVDQGLVACIGAMLDDASFPKLPCSLNSATDNQSALAAIQALHPCPVPVPFLLAILTQESGGMHYQVPRGASTDSFVTLGLDHNDQTDAQRVTSRGYGIGQYTLFHHPPTQQEVDNFILNAAQNAGMAVSILLDKFQHWIVGPADHSNDRIAEVGNGPLRTCMYQPDDSRYMSDCKACMAAAPRIDIAAGVTPTFVNSGQTYAAIDGHRGSYNNVPQRDKVGCDWPYAVRRYNGSGPASYDYQAEVLLKVLAQS